MANSALFIGWGDPVRGREQKSLQVFGEAIQYYTRLQQQGEIESFEAVALEPHGGDLQGFLLVRGDGEKLSRLRTTQEYTSLNLRAGLVVERFGVVGAYIGEDLNRLFSEFGTHATELT